MTKSIFFGFWMGFTIVNYLVNYYAPTQDVREAAKLAIVSNEPKRQDQFLYAEVMRKIGECSKNQTVAPDGVVFMYCPDKFVVTMTKWTRQNHRTKEGTVTRYYDPAGKLILIYGHPDDL